MVQRNTKLEAKKKRAVAFLAALSLHTALFTTDAYDDCYFSPPTATTSLRLSVWRASVYRRSCLE
jgi:hypothetical protein